MDYPVDKTMDGFRKVGINLEETISWPADAMATIVLLAEKLRKRLESQGHKARASGGAFVILPK